MLKVRCQHVTYCGANSHHKNSILEIASALTREEETIKLKERFLQGESSTDVNGTQINNSTSTNAAHATASLQERPEAGARKPLEPMEEDDSTLMIHFQDRSLRAYIRGAEKTEEGLRTPAFSAHLD